MRTSGEDPLGTKPSEKITRKKLASLLVEGKPEEVAVVQSAIEEFAQQLKGVICRFLKLKTWQGTEQIVVGGGFRDSRVGEIAIARTNMILRTEGVPTELQLLHTDPDHAGLIGSAHLLPAWMLQGYDVILAADIGGTNIRVGLVELNLGKAKDLSRAKVAELNRWCHRDESDLTRDEAVENLVKMINQLVVEAKKSALRLAPVIGIGCPGIIREDGSIASGAQNLPGNWESRRFNLPRAVRDRVPHIDGHDTVVVMHNDAVIQGLSEIPHMQGRRHWGILTIGTGLGNARFSSRSNHKAKD